MTLPGLIVRLLNSTKRQRARPTASLPAARALTPLRATYDAAEYDAYDAAHWDRISWLAPDLEANAGRRRTIVARARQEYRNNAYLCGIIRTYVDYAVGNGPRLQLADEADPDTAAAVEAAWSRWAAAVNLPAIVAELCQARTLDGEAFALLTTDVRSPDAVKLTVRPFEAEQVAAPAGTVDPEMLATDGIRLDAAGNPRAYTVLREHPGGPVPAAGAAWDELPAAAVLHDFRRDRAGQTRGVSDAAPALALCATLRRYVLATLRAAETVADMPVLLKTPQLPSDEPAPLGETAATATLPPLSTVDMPRGPIAMTLPDGAEPILPQPNQPPAQFSEFESRILCQLGRPWRMPLAVIRGHSADLNFASGRLDWQSWQRQLEAERRRIEANILRRLWAAWLAEALLVRGHLPAGAERYADPLRVAWYWRGAEPVNEIDAANAAEIRLRTGVSTYADECARTDTSWSDQFIQQQRERDERNRLGLDRLDAAAIPATVALVSAVAAGNLPPVAAARILEALGLSPQRAASITDTARRPAPAGAPPGAAAA